MNSRVTVSGPRNADDENIARVLVRVDHVASFIVNANLGIV
jgi:hypothetical protein